MPSLNHIAHTFTHTTPLAQQCYQVTMKVHWGAWHTKPISTHGSTRAREAYIGQKFDVCVSNGFIEIFRSKPEDMEIVCEVDKPWRVWADHTVIFYLKDEMSGEEMQGELGE